MHEDGHAALTFFSKPSLRMRRLVKKWEVKASMLFRKLI